MKLQYLGTAAAEGWPALFCDCESCRRARIVGGRNIRTRSQAMLDDRLLIDMPPDTYHHLLTNNIDISILLWLADSECKSISSFGSLMHFKEENAPAGTPDRCLDGCPVDIECPYYAPKQYLTDDAGASFG